MNRLTSFKGNLLLLVCAFPVLTGTAASTTQTLRVEHGHPVVVASEKAVLILEFAREPARDARVRHESPDMRRCRARYRFQLFEGDTGRVTSGEGMVEEIFQIVSRDGNSQRVEDRGSRTTIQAGEFHLLWSENAAGIRSWVYYRSQSMIRFIQQPRDIAFDEVDPVHFRRYLALSNVREFPVAGMKVQVIGPAYFSGDLPDERPSAGRIESGRLHANRLELKLSSLASGRTYLIERSYELKSEKWTTVHTFVAQGTEHEWSDPLDADVDMAFYRIREGH